MEPNLVWKDTVLVRTGEQPRELNRLDEALSSYDRALTLRPGFAEAQAAREACQAERPQMTPFSLSVRL